MRSWKKDRVVQPLRKQSVANIEEDGRKVVEGWVNMPWPDWLGHFKYISLFLLILYSYHAYLVPYLECSMVNFWYIS